MWPHSYSFASNFFSMECKELFLSSMVRLWPIWLGLIVVLRSSPFLHRVVVNAEADTFQPRYSDADVMRLYYSGLQRLTAHAHSTECKHRIEVEYMKHLEAIAQEQPFPFENVLFSSLCPSFDRTKVLYPVINRNYQVTNYEHEYDTIPPMRTYAKLPDELSILYIVLLHEHAELSVRLIDALDEPQHTFVIHIDLSAESVYEHVVESLRHRANVLIIDRDREHVSWGGFSMVNATMNAMRGAVAHGVDFDYLIDISGTTYPLQSNRHIREVLARNLSIVYMDVSEQALRPEPHLFQQYVECDGRLHRIARLPLIKGINMYISSQWFALPRHFVLWLVQSRLPYDYAYYAKHIVVADENYFGTMFRNSPYCDSPINRNLLFSVFDKWEHEKAADWAAVEEEEQEEGDTEEEEEDIESVRKIKENEITDGAAVFDISVKTSTTTPAPPTTAATTTYNNSIEGLDERKCLGINIEQCGRSPTTLNIRDFKTLMETSRALFARKFDPTDEKSLELLAFIDGLRKQRDIEHEAASSEGDDDDDNDADNIGFNFNDMSIEASSGARFSDKDDEGKTMKDDRVIVSSSRRTQFLQELTMISLQSTSPSRLCLAYSDTKQQQLQQAAFSHSFVNPISAYKCNASDPRQWFTIDRCTGGKRVVLSDDKCPYFASKFGHFVNNSMGSASATSTSSAAAAAATTAAATAASLVEEESRLVNVNIAANGIPGISDVITDMISSSSSSSSSSTHSRSRSGGGAHSDEESRPIETTSISGMSEEVYCSIGVPWAGAKMAQLDSFIREAVRSTTKELQKRYQQQAEEVAVVEVNSKGGDREDKDDDDDDAEEEEEASSYYSYNNNDDDDDDQEDKDDDDGVGVGDDAEQSPPVMNEDKIQQCKECEQQEEKEKEEEGKNSKQTSSGSGGTNSITNSIANTNRRSNSMYMEDVCFDVRGEQIREGAGLIGYGCTGRWNQLFVLGKDCTLTVEQPAAVSRIRNKANNNNNNNNNNNSKKESKKKKKKVRSDATVCLLGIHIQSMSDGSSSSSSDKDIVSSSRSRSSNSRSSSSSSSSNGHMNSQSHSQNEISVSSIKGRLEGAPLRTFRCGNPSISPEGVAYSSSSTTASPFSTAATTAAATATTTTTTTKNEQITNVHEKKADLMHSVSSSSSSSLVHHFDFFPATGAKYKQFLSVAEYR